ncbi:hypothetical protein EYF80_045665 [Liparis tanakae]|uniref:VWF/SSPO/Zonadhesin-like cysteine-rich domain-containing protein n=1 Tax=Liparis tanakae TaxID=230148 RepID=A0A4Z2FSG6_9TELE|nr:hypothetical protein EYF80_045665 [Liparis tanakae]
MNGQLVSSDAGRGQRTHAQVLSGSRSSVRQPHHKLLQDDLRHHAPRTLPGYRAAGIWSLGFSMPFAKLQKKLRSRPNESSGKNLRIMRKELLREGKRNETGTVPKGGSPSEQRNTDRINDIHVYSDWLVDVDVVEQRSLVSRWSGHTLAKPVVSHQLEDVMVRGVKQVKIEIFGKDRGGSGLFGLCGDPQTDSETQLVVEDAYNSAYSVSGCDASPSAEVDITTDCSASDDYCDQMSQASFDDCGLLDPLPFITACKNKACIYAEEERPVDYLACQYLEAYAKACILATDATLGDWRSKGQEGQRVT